MGRLHLEICTVWRADPPFPQAHGTKAVPLPPVPAFVLTIRPSVTAHEATLMSTEVVFYTYCTLRSRAAQQRTHTHTTHNKDHASWQPFLFSMGELSAVTSRRATRAVCWKRHGDDSQHSHRHAEQEKQQETSTATQSQQQRRMYFLYSFLLLFLNWNVPIWLDGEGGKQQNQLNFSCSLFGGFKDLLIYLYISFFFLFEFTPCWILWTKGELWHRHMRALVTGFFGPLTDGTRVFFLPVSLVTSNTLDQTSSSCLYYQYY